MATLTTGELAAQDFVEPAVPGVVEPVPEVVEPAAADAYPWIESPLAPEPEVPADRVEPAEPLEPLDSAETLEPLERDGLMETPEGEGFADDGLVPIDLEPWRQSPTDLEPTLAAPGGLQIGSVGGEFLEQMLGIQEQKAFNYGISVRATYNSNLELDTTGEEDDIVLSVSPYVSWTSAPGGGASTVATVTYSPSYQDYLNGTQDSRLNHSLGATLRWTGARSSLGANLAYSRAAQSNRFAAAFVESDTLSLSFNGSYTFSPKTRMTASLGFSPSSFDNLSGSDFTSYSAQVTGWWQATPRISLGPSLRYSVTNSDGSGDRETLALLMRLSYQIWKVSVTASGGVEKQDYSGFGGGSDDTRFTGSITGSFAHASEDPLWNYGFNVSNTTTPSLATTGEFANDFGVNVFLNRRIAIGTAGVGVSYNISDYEQVGPVAMPRDTDHYWSIYANYGRPAFIKNLNFSSSLRYSENSGSNDFSSVQASAGLNYSF